MSTSHPISIRNNQSTEEAFPPSTSASSSANASPLNQAVSNLAENIQGLSATNVHEVLNILSTKQPYGRLALGEALARSKVLSNSPNHGALTQFLWGKTLEQLPTPSALLNELGFSFQQKPSPLGLKALVSLINRHAPALIEHALDTFDQEGNVEALIQLNTFLNSLVQHTTHTSNVFWIHPLHPQTIRSFMGLIKEQRRLVESTRPIPATQKQTLLGTIEQTLAWLEKADTLSQIHHSDTPPTIRVTERNDKDIIYALIERFGGHSLHSASQELKADPEMVLAAVRNTGAALEYAAPALQADPNIVHAAISNNGWALKFAHETLQSDFNMVLTAVSNDGWALQYASEDLKADRDIVLAAVHNKGNALYLTTDALKSDPDVVLAAVSNHGFALEHASTELKATRHIAKTAIQNHGASLQFAHESLQNDFDLVQTAVNKHGWALEYASEALRNHRELVLSAVQNSGNALQFAGNTLREDREIALAAVKHTGASLEFVGETLKADKDLVLTAIRSRIRGKAQAFEHAHPSLQTDAELRKAAGLPARMKQRGPNKLNR